MNTFKNFEDFKSRADNEYINDLFYFFKGYVQDKEWHPQTEVTFYGLNGELDEGITLTLGEARDFLRENYSRAKTEEVANSFSERVKNVEAWKPEQSGSASWIPPIEKEAASSSDNDLEPEIDRDVIDDEEYEEYFDDQEEEELDEEESFEEFLEEFLEDDEDSKDETVRSKDKDKRKKRKKVKVLGEELPFEADDSNHQKEMATEKAIIEEAKSRHEKSFEDEPIEEGIEVSKESEGKFEELELISEEQGTESFHEVNWPEFYHDSKPSSPAENAEFTDQHHVQGNDYRDNTEPSTVSEQHTSDDDGLLEIDFGEDWNNNEEAKLAKLTEEQEQSSINPIIGVVAGISKILNRKDYEYQGEDAKLFGQYEPEDVNRQKEAATEAAIIELAKQRAEQNVRVELIEEDVFEQTRTSHEYNEMERDHKTMEEAFNETLHKMGSDLDDINQYDEHGQVIHPEVVIDKMLSEDENATSAFKGHGSAGDMSAFGQAFKDFAYQMGNGNNNGYENGSNVADILNGLVMGMAFTGSGDQIRETVHEPVIPPQVSPAEHIRGVHESLDGQHLGVESGFNLDDYGNLKTAAQERYEAEKRDNYEIGQDTRDIQKFVDAVIADKDARDAVMVQSYGQEMVTMPASTMMQGEDFNRVYMEHFADVTAVEFSAAPIPENAQTVDFSVANNGAVLGYEENSVLYITAAPAYNSDLSMVTELQVYLNPDSAGMFKDAVNLQTVSFGDNIADTSFVHNMGGMFINCENLTTVNANYLNTERLQNIDGLFANCSNLEIFNNEGWKTNNVITASFAFSECHALTQDPSANWHMENLRYADGFMSGCVGLTHIDMSDWNARNLLSIREMFNGCSSAEYININGLNTINVKDMAGMFKCCESLEDLNLSKLNTSSLSPVVEGKGGAEIGCQGDFGHPIDDIFYGCTKLAESGEFKSQAMAWEAAANRAVELNAPVYMETRVRPTSYEQLSIPIITEVQNKDGSVSRMTSYHNQDGSTTFVIPPVYQPSSERMMESNIQASQPPVMVMLKSNDDGTTSVITSKTNTDGSRVIQTETVGVDGQIISGNIASYDKNGTQILNVSEDKMQDSLKLSSLKVNADGSISVATSKTFDGNFKIISTETFDKSGASKNEFALYDKNGALVSNVPASKLEELAKMSDSGVVFTTGSDGGITITTSKVFTDSSKVVKTEEFAKDGSLLKESFAGYDKNNSQLDNISNARFEELLKSATGSIELKKNEDGTTSIAISKLNTDSSQTIRTEVFANGNVLKDNVVTYDKNGIKVSEMPSNKFEEALKTGAILVTAKVNTDGVVSIVTEKTYADKMMVVQTETVRKDGTIVKDIVGYDQNGKQLSSISQDKLLELASAKKLEINQKSNEHQVVMTVSKADGTKATTTINVDKNNKNITNITVYGKDGNLKSVNAPVFTNGQKGQSDDKTKKRRESKGNEGHVFGNSKSSNERKIYDAAKLKKEQNIYKTGKVVEEFGKGAKPVLGAAYKAAKSLINNPQDDSLLAEASKKMGKYKGVVKSVVSGIFGVSIAASLKAEQIDFKKTMKAAQVTKGIEGKLKDNGITLASLQDKSQREVVQTLSGLKDSHGRKLLSDKQIRDIAKYRNGAVDMVNFQKTVENARNAGLFQNMSKDGKALTDKQRKSLEKFNLGRLDKMSAKDIATITDAYFSRATSSPLYGLKVSALTKSQLDNILTGKDPIIDVKKLSETEKSMLKVAGRSRSIKDKKRDIKANQAFKRMQPFSFNNAMKLLQKTGSGIAQETAQLVSDVRRKGSLVYTGAYTAIQVASIYGGLGLRGVKFVGKGLAKTRPGRIIVKAGDKISSVVGKSAVGRGVKSIKKAKANWKEEREIRKQVKQTIKSQKKLNRQQALRDGAKKVADKARNSATGKAVTKAANKARRTVAGRAAAKAVGKAKMIASKAGKTVNAIGNVISAPFKGLAWAGGKLGVLVNTARKALSKLLIYLAAGIAGFLIIFYVLIMLISAISGAGASGANINSSIMSPPSVDEQDDPLNITEAEYDARWETFKLLIQEKYKDSKDAQIGVVDDIDVLFGAIPNINGSPIIGWAGDQIMEYGVPADIAENDGYWIAYEPQADDNAKDAIALAYVIMGSKDFYYDEIARNKLIADLIALMNPKLEESDITNTIYPGSTYADEDKKIYACLTGCETLTYYCADDLSYFNFYKSGCESKSKNYIGTNSVKNLQDCVRLSTDGTTILANETKVPNAVEPVIYVDNLISHTYGDSYTSTCTGEESITIGYSYSTSVSYYLANGYVYPSGGMTADEIAEEHGYKTAQWNDDDEVWDIYDDRGDFIRSVNPWYWEGSDDGVKNDYLTATLADLGAEYMHGSYTYPHGGATGVNSASEVTGPSSSIIIPEWKLISYTEEKTGLDVDSASLSSVVSSTCSSWEVKFECSGHLISICPNGHTDLGVTISQYGAEDFQCFGGTKLDLPYDSTYQSYINKFMALPSREGELAMLKAIVENDWYTLYGVNDQQILSVAENSKISEAYIYNILVSEPEETGNGLGMGMGKAQAAAFLGYIKVASDFKINAESGGYYGLCLWAEEQLERIGRGSEDNQATLTEQIMLLINEYADVSMNSGFKSANDLVDFRGCKETIAGVQEAAKILVQKWTYGHVDDVSAVQAAAVGYFNRINSGTDKDFFNPRLSTISNYVSWALKTAASPEHGYCQGKFQNGSIGDFQCGTFVSAALSAGTKGTSDEVPGNWHNSPRFEIIEFPVGVTEADLQFGDLIYHPMEGADTSDHIEIYIGNGCSVGARGADGNYGCSQSDEHWTKHPSSWTDHVFHKAGDQGIRWKNGSYTYNEIAASAVDLSKYKRVYRLRP